MEEFEKDRKEVKNKGLNNQIECVKQVDITTFVTNGYKFGKLLHAHLTLLIYIIKFLFITDKQYLPTILFGAI